MYIVSHIFYQAPYEHATGIFFETAAENQWREGAFKCTQLAVNTKVCLVLMKTYVNVQVVLMNIHL